MTSNPIHQKIVGAVVLRSVTHSDGTHCVDIFERSDGSFGFELYRRDVEDAQGWFAIGGFVGLEFASFEAALNAAEKEFDWLEQL